MKGSFIFIYIYIMICCVLNKKIQISNFLCELEEDKLSKSKVFKGYADIDKINSYFL